jgi:ankyrin repeat protein
MVRKTVQFVFLLFLFAVSGCSSRMSLYQAIQEDDAEAVQRIAEWDRSSLSLFSSMGSSPLLYAMEQDSRNAYLALLEGGADPNKIGPRGANLMTHSARCPDVFWLKKALEHGGDPNLDNHAATARRTTPLLQAARDECLEGLKLLVDEYHANIDCVPDFRDALVHAAGTNDFQAVLFLLKSGANYRRKTGTYTSFANEIKHKRIEGFLIEKDRKNFQAVIDWLRGQGVEWDKPVPDGEIWSYSKMP